MHAYICTLWRTGSWRWVEIRVKGGYDRDIAYIFMNIFKEFKKKHPFYRKEKRNKGVGLSPIVAEM